METAVPVWEEYMDPLWAGVRKSEGAGSRKNGLAGDGIQHLHWL